MSRATGLHLVADDRLPFDRLCQVVEASVSAGAAVVQLRAKDVSARELVERASVLAGLIDGRSVLVVNDRVDVVLAARHAGARVDGVHVGQDDIDPAAARAALGPDAVVGWTAHRAEHLAAARRMDRGTVDYLGVGVIRATPTKTDHPPVLGIDGFADVVRRASLPCIAIGGVTADDVPALVDAGAAGVAVVSAICAAEDPGAATSEIVGRLGAMRRAS